MPRVLAALSTLDYPLTAELTWAKTEYAQAKGKEKPS